MPQPLRLFAPLLLTCLVLIGCTNRPAVCVCDPCGCTRVAAPLLDGCGVGSAPEVSEEATPVASEASALSKTRKELPEHALATTKVKEVAWENVNLDKALSQLVKLTGVDFYVSPKVREEKFDDIRYNLHVADVTAISLLELMTEPFGLRHEARGSVIWILTDEEIDGPKRLRYYDVKDLMGEGAAFASVEEVMADVRTEVHPTYWDEEEAVIEGRNGILIVRASQGVHKAVGDQLSHRRRKAAPVILSAETAQKLSALKLNFEVEDMTIDNALKVLQIQTGLNLLIDPRIRADVADKEIPSLNLKDTPVIVLLERLGEAAGEGTIWVEKESVLVLSLLELLDGQ